METWNRLKVTREEEEGGKGRKKGKGQAKEHEQSTSGQGQWVGIDCRSVGDGVGVSNEEKGGTIVTEEQ